MLVVNAIKPAHIINVSDRATRLVEAPLTGGAFVFIAGCELDSDATLPLVLVGEEPADEDEPSVLCADPVLDAVVTIVEAVCDARLVVSWLLLLVACADTDCSVVLTEGCVALTEPVVTLAVGEDEIVIEAELTTPGGGITVDLDSETTAELALEPALGLVEAV